MEKISYWAVIPASVRYDNQLSNGAKLLYAEITALCNKEGYCWATNKYFGQLYNVGNRTIRRWIQELKSREYIILNDNNSCKRKIYITKENIVNEDKNVRETRTKMSAKRGQKCPRNEDKNVQNEGFTLLMNNIKNNKREYRENSLSISDPYKQDGKDEEVIKRRTYKFEEIFKKYPRQTYHDKSLKMFLTTITNNEEYNKLKKAIKNYSESDEVWKGRVMNFTNFLPDYDFWAKQEN